MAYLKYQEYLTFGGVLDETAFNRNIDRACSVIDRYTYKRITLMLNVPSEVKALCRDLVEYYATNATVNEKGVSSWSQSAGPVSESVSYESKGSEDIETDVRNIVFDYLWTTLDDNGTPVLYKGACS
jgi:glycosylphosphatidylinositol transamidase (GPIT) subunit GPI8